MKRISAFAASVVALGLYTAPVGAQLTGTIQGLSQGQVVCVNSTDTGVGTVSGPLTAGSFDCSQLPITPGDHVTIVIAGPVGEGGGGTGCSTVPEREPNDLRTPQEFQNLGTLPAGGCVAVNGTITAGIGPDPSNPTPNADVDFYATFNLTGISQLEFDLDSDGRAFFRIFNARTGDSLGECPSLPCILPVPTGADAAVAVRIRGENPLSYTFRLADATPVGGPPAAQSLKLPTSDKLQDWRLQNMR
jgi:hypothetical protein